MEITRERVISLLIALVIIAISFFQGQAHPGMTFTMRGQYYANGWTCALLCTGYLLLPLACIWYSDYLGAGWGGAGSIEDGNTDLPSPLVKIIGWILLFLPLYAPACAKLLSS